MTAREQFYQDLADGFNLELSGRGREEKRSIIIKARAKSIPSPSLCSEFIYLVKKQGTLLLSSIWSDEPGRKQRLRHVSMATVLVENDLFSRVDDVDFATLERTGYSKWYITNPAFMQFLPGNWNPSEAILAEIHTLACLEKAGFTVYTSAVDGRRVTFLAVREGEKIPVVVDAANDSVCIGGEIVPIWDLEKEYENKHN